MNRFFLVIDLFEDQSAVAFGGDGIIEILPSELLWGAAEMLLEEPAHVFWVGKARFVGDLEDPFGRIPHKADSQLQAPLVDVSLEIDS